MECEKWIDGRLHGRATFTRDQRGATVSAHDGLSYLQDYSYSVLYEGGSRTVLSGVGRPADSLPLVIISLDFSRPRAFVYNYIGDYTEGDTIISKVEWRCSRLD